MRAILVMFDSLNRHMLPPYGCAWTHAPNFARLAARTATFDRAYICSAPCMPARHDLHTARPEFLHRAWGPLEPFDTSFVERLSHHGIYTHLVSDHFHYWEDEGVNYNTRYDTWEFMRGQEGDAWMGQVRNPDVPPVVLAREHRNWRQDWVNRQFIRSEEDYPQTKCFDAGLDFIRRNQSADNWFLTIECFDPHEPFMAPQRFRDLYQHDYQGKHFDWPPYRAVQETPDEVRHATMEYAALLSMCDHSLGRILDAMDARNMWDDTMLIVCTDHGFLLGQHNSWAKNWCPWWEELSHVPLFIWDPRAKAAGVRRNSLVQILDFGPTLLDLFNVPPTDDMLGRSLKDTIAHDAPVRNAAIFGIFSGQVNVTDGRYVYMRGSANPDNQPLHEYTLTVSRFRKAMQNGTFPAVTLVDPLPFSKHIPVFKVPSNRQLGGTLPTLLFDLQTDPTQQTPLTDPNIEARMITLLKQQMTQAHTPQEQYIRLGLA